MEILILKSLYSIGFILGFCYSLNLKNKDFGELFDNIVFSIIVGSFSFLGLLALYLSNKEIEYDIKNERY